MDETIVILGNGFDRNLGIDLSFNAYCNYHLCPACNPLNIDKKDGVISKMKYVKRFYHGIIIKEMKNTLNI